MSDAPDLKAHMAAQEWLAGYYGSIDATALLLAFKAGAQWEREECAKLAQDAWCLMSTFSIEQSAQYAAACAEVAKIIRSRAAADSLLESEE